MEAGPEPLVPEPKESRISRFLARRWAVPGVIAGAVTIFTLACITPDLVARWQLSRERDAVRARGEPATLAELAPEMPPDDENAAVLLTQAFKLMDAGMASEPADWVDFLYEEDGAHRADAEAAIKIHAKAMAVARKALARPRCVFDLDYTKGAALALPHLAKLRALARLFTAEAILNALDGKGPGAAGSIRQVFLLARALDEERLFISKLVGIAVVGIGMDALCKTEIMKALGDEQLVALIELIESLNFEKTATEAFIADRAFTVDADNSVAAMTPAGTGSISRWLAARQMRLSPREKLRAMRLSTAIIEATRLPPWEARPIIEEQYRELWALLPWSASLSALGEPWKRYYTVFMCAMARSDAAVIGLSCELFRSGAGRYPTTLDELAPDTLEELPPDPFTGKPFMYELRDDGRAFIVYSVGPDLDDEGGVKDYPEKDDISWEGSAAKE